MQKLFSFAVLIRIITKFYAHDWLSKRPELVVAHNSYRRLVDGVQMRLDGFSPYDGDMLHCAPMLLDVMKPFIDHPNVVFTIFVIFDFIIAELLRMTASIYLKSNETDKPSEHCRICNLVMKLLSAPDFTPNVGIFWYFFTEVFNHFRLFFLWVFQLNVFVYLFPLTLTLRSNAFLLLHQFLILLSVFASYPTMTDSAIYLSLLPIFLSLHKYARWTLVIAVTWATCVVLLPVMWRMWIVSGSGNANFYFAVTLCYSMAQIFLMTDLIYSNLRKKATMERGSIAQTDTAVFVFK
ncbi:unnamed protein product [Anisakis simplex]|uniref:Phosphatidylinositol glycan, class U n=1 Tax=Anisakis simplex TaxID=6269 RepID=A0A0M3JWD0_ANISI|nr:unnamed protein product [Anisakis simplex]